MANIDTVKPIDYDNAAKNNKNATKLLIITSINDDEEKKILSCLNSTNNETVFVNLNNQNRNDLSIINKNKRSLSQLINDTSTNGNIKRRKPDLTCIICQGDAYGHNFGQITCESCKAFFRRNALHVIEKTKCNNSNKVRCNIRYDVKQKCQRCRLLKCLESGMRKDLIVTPEAKLTKQRRLEENRRGCVTQIKTEAHHIKMESIEEHPDVSVNCNSLIAKPSYHLTENEWSYLYYIKNAYLSATQSIPSASSVISLELASDRMSAYMNTLDLQNFGAVKLIHFLRQIPDFEELNEKDRVILVKYNLCSLGLIRSALTFDTAREICYDDNINNSVSPDDEAFAQQCKSLYIVCYGYELNRSFVNILHTIHNLIDNDPIIIQLLMLNMILLKGLTANDDQEPILNDNQRVFHVHSKFTDLLFRYLIEQSSFNTAVIKMMYIVQALLKIQRVMRDFHDQLKSKIDVNYINPLMKSLLHLT